MIFWLLRPVYFWDRPRFLRMLVEKAETKGVSYEDLVMVEAVSKIEEAKKVVIPRILLS